MTEIGIVGSDAGGTQGRGKGMDARLEDAHRVLRVALGADPVTLRRAYRARLLATHPDHGGDAHELAAVVAAWEVVAAHGMNQVRPTSAPTAANPYARVLADLDAAAAIDLREVATPATRPRRAPTASARAFAAVLQRMESSAA